MGEATKVEDKKTDGGEKKTAVVENDNTVVLKTELHCEGCAKKVKRYIIRTFIDVEDVKTECATNKVTLRGINLDANYVRDKVEEKFRKKVELISSPTTKTPPNNKDDVGDKKPPPPEEKKAEGNEKKHEEIKPREIQATTVVLKIPLHCDGCAHKIKRIIKKTEGVENVKIDLDKDMATVKGTMDVKDDLLPYLKVKLNRTIDILPVAGDGGATAKKEKEGVGAGGDKKENVEKTGGDDTKEAVELPETKDKDTKKEDTKIGVSKFESQGYMIPPYTYYGVTSPGNGYQYYGSDATENMYSHQYNYTQRIAPPPPPPTFLTYADQTFPDENGQTCYIM